MFSRDLICYYVFLEKKLILFPLLKVALGKLDVRRVWLKEHEHVCFEQIMRRNMTICLVFSSTSHTRWQNERNIIRFFISHVNQVCCSSHSDLLSETWRHSMTYTWQSGREKRSSPTKSAENVIWKCPPRQGWQSFPFFALLAIFNSFWCVILMYRKENADVLTGYIYMCIVGVH